MTNEKDREERPSPDSEAGPVEEVGGPKGPEPTCHGEWEINGRAVDF